MFCFDDFDAWGDAVRGANLRLICDRIETNLWRLGVANLGPVVVQAAFEGGGNLCYGANTHRGPTLFVPLTLAERHVANGERLDDRSFLFIPPGADFRIQVRRLAHAWCSIALPPEEHALPDGGRASRIVRADPAAVRRLRSLAESVVTSPVFAARPGAAHAAAALQLREAVSACLAAPALAPSVVGRPRIDRAEIMRRALGSLEAEEPLQRRSVAALARTVGVNERTLARAFHESFGVSPRTYVGLRQLHEVRRALRQGRALGRTVADVLVGHCIWEFGRFATRYRRQFGESPSDTLRRGDG
jgi:AraC family ethanolamine operon transcriptional activator